MPLYVRITLALAVAACVATHEAAAQVDVELRPIGEWMPVGPGVETRVTPDGLLLTAGTIRTPAPLADFVLRFEYRLAAAGADAELLLRARGASDGPLGYGYRVALGGDTAGRRPRGRIRTDGTQMRAGLYTGPRTPSASGRWVTCEVRGERDTLSVSLDGMAVSVADRATAFSGFVAFEATGPGGIELRDVRIASTNPAVDGTRGLPAAGAPGITPPETTRRASPRYTAAAMAARVVGIAMLEFVIEADGSVGAVRVIDAPHPDLARSSVDCVRESRFTPATRNGVPVAAVATMELAFNLGP